MLDEKLSLEDLLEKIYFEEFAFDDLKEYVFPALRSIADINALFDVLFNAIRSFSEVFF